MLRLGRGRVAAVKVRPNQYLEVQVLRHHEQLCSRAIFATLRSGKATRNKRFAAHCCKTLITLDASCGVRHKTFLHVKSSRLAVFLRRSRVLCCLQKGVAWHNLLTQRLSKDVKLVGPVINCEGSYYQGNESGILRQNPHVQSYVMAMDRKTIEILEKEGNVLQCHQNRWDAIYFGELGSSLAILRAGYNIDSLLSR